ncbi:integrin-linked kinase-associated serine/threonine phosphatase 2C isoform X1 [Parasteatoda tepidariorum]|uniref:integrin-linked kinase-associated serine/threonine phosphatase 2C isoform X2 n=1 Tax=Parasteatoda tepidariorum TaxID=114398 RepID=UPI001C71CAA3|nr:integrin-linked kinase-associated serine/threonine phosphatase 2C [Parasteatoda tepidariorum]
MDLFEDLPEPGSQKASILSPETHSWGNASIDIFSDLPDPSTQTRGVKRKIEDENGKNICEILNEEKLYDIQGFSAEKKGEREEMQDFHILIDDYHKFISDLHPSISRLSYYAVFDGHGGARASKFAANQLHTHLAQKFPKGPSVNIEKDIKRTLTDVFKKTDEEFLKQASKSKPSWKDGTTAIVVLVIQNILYITNLGDSKAILCRYNNKAGKHVCVPLSTDHSPTDYKERMRIQKAGGSVRDGRVMGVIEVSRSIGDGQYKALGLCSVPDVKRCQLTDDDLFILLACDGLWKVFSSEEVINIVLSCKKERSENKNEICYESACNKLVNEAIRKYSGDNVTVVILSVKKN